MPPDAVHYLPTLSASMPLCGVLAPATSLACTRSPHLVTCPGCLRKGVHGPMPERVLLAQVREIAKRCGFATYHTHLSKKSEPGFPDVVLLKPPLLLFAELKRQGERPTAAQHAWLTALGQVQQVAAHLWYPADLPQIIAVLSRKEP